MSAISIIEIVYLVEKHRINAGAVNRIREACEAEDPSIEIVPVDARVAYGIDEVARADVPDMPDRIIAATAAALGVPLVTRDGKIRASGVHTIRAGTSSPVAEAQGVRRTVKPSHMKSS